MISFSEMATGLTETIIVLRERLYFHNNGDYLKTIIFLLEKIILSKKTIVSLEIGIVFSETMFVYKENKIALIGG